MNKRECETCIKKKTMYCPNSSKCLKTEDKLYYQNKLMSLEKNKQLQNNWNELKKWLIQLQKFKGINQQGFSWGVAQEVLDKMQELEGNNVNTSN